jgi:hypothetical protein
MQIVNIPGVPTNVAEHPSVTQARIMRDGNRWRIAIELTFDVLPEDIEVRYEGDDERDFASRALSRVRGALNAIIGWMPGARERDTTATFRHFHVLETPRRVFEHD